MRSSLQLGGAFLDTLFELTHEINQALAAVVNNANAYLRWLAAQNLGEARRSAELVIADGHRASDIMSGIRTLFKERFSPDLSWTAGVSNSKRQ